MTWDNISEGIKQSTWSRKYSKTLTSVHTYALNLTVLFWDIYLRVIFYFILFLFVCFFLSFSVFLSLLLFHGVVCKKDKWQSRTLTLSVNLSHIRFTKSHRLNVLGGKNVENNLPLLDRHVSGGGRVAREVKDHVEEAGMREEVHPNEVTKVMAKPHRVR